jgi:hypothetical protein
MCRILVNPTMRAQLMCLLLFCADIVSVMILYEKVVALFSSIILLPS